MKSTTENPSTMKVCLVLLLACISICHSARTCYRDNGDNTYRCGARTYQKPTTDKRRICFFTDWANVKARKDKGIEMDWYRVDPFLCSHINYCFTRVGNDTHNYEMIHRTEKVKTPGFMKNLKKLKKINKNLKIIISVGGASHDKVEPRFHKMVAYKSRRDNFVASVVKFLKKYDADGFSLDWEYPNWEPKIKGDAKQRVERDKFTALCRELRAAFDLNQPANKRWTLSASVSAGTVKIDTAYDVPAMNDILDWVNVMAYALWTQIKPVTGHYTAMARPTEPGNYMERYHDKIAPVAIQTWIDRGMSRGKINLGCATYGRSFKLKDPSQHGLTAPAAGNGRPGPLLNKAGKLPYFEICSMPWTNIVPYQTSAVKAPYASNGDLWVAYESPASLAYKVDQVVNKFVSEGVESGGVGGISFWELGLDDFINYCNNKRGHYPLIRSAVMAMD